MKEQLRICFVSFMFSPSVGGAQIRAEKQARQLQALGHDVMVITLRLERSWARTTKLNGLPVVRVGGIYRRDGSLRIGRLGIWAVSIGLFVELWRLHHHYDVIHAFQVTPLAAVAALIGKITRKPVVISSQSAGSTEEGQQGTQLKSEVMLLADTLTDTSFLKIDPSKAWIGAGDINNLLQNTLGGHILLNFLRRSNAFYQVLSTRSQSYLISWGFRREQVVYIPGSVDTEKFRPAPERRPDPHRPERNIICVARLEYSKGIDVLLHAWKRMMLTSAEWQAQLEPRLLLVGDGVLQPQLKRMVMELNIQDNVEFLGLRTDIIDLLQQSWGYVLPSRGEGMPNALLEAMACGLPCIATRVSGSEDILVDGVNGLLVESEQPVELAHALRRLVEDADLAQRLAEEGRARVVHNYQLTRIVEQLLYLYRSLLSKGQNKKLDKVNSQNSSLLALGEKEK
jgi:glycosyltransferase involved in cell wall biosynthesis